MSLFEMKPRQNVSELIAIVSRTPPCRAAATDSVLDFPEGSDNALPGFVNLARKSPEGDMDVEDC